MDKVVLGFAPTRRAIFSAPAAVVYRGLTAKRLKELNVDFVDIDDVNDEGLLYDDAGMEKIYEKAAQLGGKVSGEHGIGFAKKPYLRESLDPETIELMSGIKKAFDPKNILNPHKVFQG